MSLGYPKEHNYIMVINLFGLRGLFPTGYYLVLQGNRNANRVFPGGFEVTDAVDQNGKKIASATNPLFFTTAGWFSMEMNVGNTEVNRFSDPIDVEIPIGDSVINPATKKPVKVGDKIPIWSLHNGTATWRLESEAEITAPTGKGLNAKIKINHLSSFNIDYKSAPCATNILVNFTPADFSNASGYFTEYINVADNSVLKSGIAYFTGASPTPLEIRLAPDATITGKLFVHEGTDITSAGRAISTPLNCNNPTGSCTATPPTNCLALLGTVPFANCVTLQFLKGDGTSLCPNTVWLEQGPASTYLTHMGVLRSGAVNVPRITDAAGLFNIQTVILWYVDMLGKMIGVKFVINFDNGGDVQVSTSYDGTSWGVHPNLRMPL